MLIHAKKQESLTGKLLLSTALVAVTVGYGWWQHDQMAGDYQQAAVLAAMPPTRAPAQAQPRAQAQVTAAPPQTATSATDAHSGSPGTSAANAPALPGSGNGTVKSAQLAMAAPAAPAVQAATPGETVLLPATPPPPLPAPATALTGMDAIRHFFPTEDISPPLPPVTGTPDPGAAPPIPAGTHLEDGDYRSDKVSFEWGDLRVRMVVTGGKITTVQIMSYPDHRSQSLYLIQLADPFLTKEVIKTQQSQVHTVSTATNTSVAFREAVAGAIVKATR